MTPLQWRHNERDSVSDHRRLDCLLNHLFRRRSRKTSKFRVTGLCAENPLVTGEFPTQRSSNAENFDDVIMRQRRMKTFRFVYDWQQKWSEFHTQRPVARSFHVFFDLRLNKRLSKQSWGWWFEMPQHQLWRHCNAFHILSCLGKNAPISIFFQHAYCYILSLRNKCHKSHFEFAWKFYHFFQMFLLHR